MDPGLSGQIEVRSARPRPEQASSGVLRPDDESSETSDPGSVVVSAADLLTGIGPDGRVASRTERAAIRQGIPSSIRAVAGVFLWSRAAIWLIALFALLTFGPNRSTAATTLGSLDPALTHDFGYATDVWAHWDSIWFLQIAHHGYGGSPQASAFYPFYPVLVALVGKLFLGHYVAAGIAVSLISTLVSFVLLHRLARNLLGEDGARRAVLYLAVFPMALFLQAVYSESLLLALILGTFYFAEREEWGATWCLAGLALLTRPAAAALIPALLLLAWRAPQRLRALSWSPVVALEFALFPIALWRMTGDWLGFVHAEKIWHRHVSPYGPFAGLWDGTRDGLEGIARVATHQPVDGMQLTTNSGSQLFASAFNVQAFLYLVLFCFLAVVVWRRFDAVYGLFTAASLAIPLSSPNSGGWPLLSLPRFGITIFPLFLALATLGERPRVHSAIVGISALMLGLATVQWALWEWMG